MTFAITGRTVAEVGGQCCIDCGTPISSYSKGRCRKCARAMPKQTLAMPDDFAKLAASLSDRALAINYGRDETVITRWRRQSGVAHPPHPAPVNKMELPQGWRLVAPTMTRKELEKRYNCGSSTIKRWIRETGVEPRQSERTFMRRKVVGGADKQFQARIIEKRDGSRVGMAANFLQKYAAVFRCAEDGSAKPDGTCWRYGRVVLTDAEIIERAERKGWDQHAWKRLAA